MLSNKAKTTEVTKTTSTKASKNITEKRRRCNVCFHKASNSILRALYYLLTWPVLDSLTYVAHTLQTEMFATSSIINNFVQKQSRSRLVEKTNYVLCWIQKHTVKYFFLFLRSPVPGDCRLQKPHRRRSWTCLKVGLKYHTLALKEDGMRLPISRKQCDRMYTINTIWYASTKTNAELQKPQRFDANFQWRRLSTNLKCASGVTDQSASYAYDIYCQHILHLRQRRVTYVRPCCGVGSIFWRSRLG